MKTFTWGVDTATADTAPADMAEAVERVITAKAVKGEVGAAKADMVKAVEQVITAMAVMGKAGTAGVDLDSNAGMGVREGLWVGRNMRN